LRESCFVNRQRAGMAKSRKSARLPPMWPGFDSGLRGYMSSWVCCWFSLRLMWLWKFIVLVPFVWKRFFSSLPVFLYFSCHYSFVVTVCHQRSWCYLFCWKHLLSNAMQQKFLLKHVLQPNTHCSFLLLYHVFWKKFN